MNDDMVAVYRHDVHKMNGQPHSTASKMYAGVRVNQPVPNGADGDAAALSRPYGQPEQTVESHETHYRLSLIDRESRHDQEEVTRRGVEHAVRSLLTEDSPVTIHRAWLESSVVSVFNESVYYPYTSLKYHTLLVAALLDNYRAGYEFDELRLVVDDAETIIPHRTVYAGGEFALRIDGNAEQPEGAQLGSRPCRSWASTWSRLTVHPLKTAHNKWDMILDANLRRISAWSTALQYIDDFEHWHGEVNKSNKEI